ncbi:hypothetical protein Tco_0871093 [Tanacetum coccineum]
MGCSLPHTDDKVEALVHKLFDEDKVHQKAILDLALQFENACTAKDNLRKAYEKYNEIPQESRGLSSQTHEICDLYLTKKELHQLHLEEEALRETLEEATMDKKAREETIRQKQADDDESFLEFWVVRYD